MNQVEIEKEIKRLKLKIADMPWYIEDKISNALEDSGNDNFITGKEEGIAQEKEEWESKEVDEAFPESYYQGVLHYLKLAKSGNIDEVIKEMEGEVCRHMK